MDKQYSNDPSSGELVDDPEVIPATSQELESLDDDAINAYYRNLDQETRHRLRMLDFWLDDAEGAHSKNTWRAWRSDWRLWVSWCAKYRLVPLPADPEHVARYVREMGTTRDYDKEERERAQLQADAKTAKFQPRRRYLKSQATVSRYVSTIDRLHLGAGIHYPPGRSETVRLALKSVKRLQGTRQRQMWGMRWATLERILEKLDQDEAKALDEDTPAAERPNYLQILRDRALVLTGYDLLARREELSELLWGNIEESPDGSGVATIARAKGDPLGSGTHHHLAYTTMLALKAWRAAAWPDGDPDPAETALRGIWAWGRAPSQNPLNPGSVVEILRRLGRCCELPETTITDIGGHSLRIGAAQDLRAEGFGLLEIMQSARWKQAEMAQRYTEKVGTKEQAMGRLAERQGRDKAAKKYEK